MQPYAIGDTDLNIIDAVVDVLGILHFLETSLLFRQVADLKFNQCHIILGGQNHHLEKKAMNVFSSSDNLLCSNWTSVVFSWKLKFYVNYDIKRE